MNNTTYIYQPHYMSNCFRVAQNKQLGKEFNYIVVTCSPTYNGVWKYPSSNLKNYDIWLNDKLVCWQVPIDDCERIKYLEELSNKDVIKEVKKQQSKWYKSQVKNNPKEYKDKPDWML